MSDKIKTSEQAEKARALFHEERRRRVSIGLKQMLASQEGRAFAWELLSSARIYGDCYASSPTDTAYNLGARSVGLNLLNLINNSNPDAMGIMTKENNPNV